GVEMVEIAEELVEAIHGRQRVVAVADVILAKLPGRVTELLEQAADRRITLAHSHRSPGKSNLRQSGPDSMLPGQERRSTCGAGLLAIVMQESDPLAGDPVDIGRLIAHETAGIGADIGDADIVAEDDENVRLAVAGRWRCGGSRRRGLLVLAK